MENIGMAFQLMIVGMGTVFIILLIVIYLGKLLIKLVNDYAPAEVVSKKSAQPVRQAAVIDELTKEIISQAVMTVTGGKGKVTDIKLNQ